jgi:hypothetical protein
VVGSDKSVEAPPGVSAESELFHEDVAVLETTLAGQSCLSERSARRSGDIGSPLPPRRLYDREVFRRSACRAVRRPPGGSRRLGRPLRVRAPRPPRSCRTGSPLLGFLAPPATSAKGSGSPGPSTARHLPPSGFLTPSAGCSPFGLADSLGPLPLMGFSLAGLFRAVGPRRVAAPLHPFVRSALQPRTLRNTRSRAPRPPRHLSPPALVPRPWFQSPQAPSGAHHSRAVAGAFAPAGPLARLSPPRLGEP